MELRYVANPAASAAAVADRGRQAHFLDHHFGDALHRSTRFNADVENIEPITGLLPDQQDRRHQIAHVQIRFVLPAIAEYVQDIRVALQFGDEIVNNTVGGPAADHVRKAHDPGT